MHEIAKQLDLAFTRLYKEGYDVAVVRLFSCSKKNASKTKICARYSQVYTDVLRRVSETDGPRSPELKRVLGELDELLQATLIDIGAKDERAGIKGWRNSLLTHRFSFRYLNTKVFELGTLESHLGASIYDVRKILGNFYLLSPLFVLY